MNFRTFKRRNNLNAQGRTRESLLKDVRDFVYSGVTANAYLKPVSERASGGYVMSYWPFD